MKEFIQINAVDILSLIMALWLIWIIMTYTVYFRNLKKTKIIATLNYDKTELLQKARDKRNRVYNIAVAYPSYIIFWIAVASWGVSYLLKPTLD